MHLLARRGGITVLVSTHYMDEAEHCDRLGLMHQGRLIAVGRAGRASQGAPEQEGGPVVAVDAHDFAAAYQVLHAAFPAAMLYGRRIQWQSADAGRRYPAGRRPAARGRPRTGSRVSSA